MKRGPLLALTGAATFVVVFGAIKVVAGCRHTSHGGPRVPGTRAEEALRLVEPVYDGGFQNGWEDWGWAPRDTKGDGPAKVNFSDYGGFIVAKPAFTSAGEDATLGFGAFTFRVKAPKSFGDFLEVRVDSEQKNDYPRIIVGPQHRRDLGDDWEEVVISMRELNPENLPFDRIVFRAPESIDSDWVLLDKMGFTKGSGAAGTVVRKAVATKEVNLAVFGDKQPLPISPMIYGIAYDVMKTGDETAEKLGAASRRWGGNPASRYNWELGNAWSAANDWFWENLNFSKDPGYTYSRFLDDNAARGFTTALTIPMLGWVAKDTTSCSFPVSEYKNQDDKDEGKGCGNGKKDGKEIDPGPPSRTSVVSTPEWVGRWLAAIRRADAAKGRRSVQEYILDNEPTLWDSTHRDVHPQPLTYDELLDKTIKYGTVVRNADPDAFIAGPAEWGWPGYNWSGKDAAVGFKLKPDRRAHGDMPLVAWYLQKLHEHEQQTGQRLLDVLDLHFYPQAEHVGGEHGGVDTKTAALRLRSTRALWDPSYHDESWIDENVQLIPRMKQWIDTYYPGRGMSIGEWNFGAEGHISGGLAVAEVLGRFGQNGLTSAYYWTVPPDKTPAFWAFRAYRNFDGHGGRFLDFSLPTTMAPGAVSLFASRDKEGKHVVLVALNLTPDIAEKATIDLSSCGPIASRRTFVYGGGSAGFVEKPSPTADASAAPAKAMTIVETLDPYTMNVFALELARPLPPVK